MLFMDGPLLTHEVYYYSAAAAASNERKEKEKIEIEIAVLCCLKELHRKKKKEKLTSIVSIFTYTYGSQRRSASVRNNMIGATAAQQLLRRRSVLLHTMVKIDDFWSKNSVHYFILNN